MDAAMRSSILLELICSASPTVVDFHRGRFHEESIPYYALCIASSCTSFLLYTEEMTMYAPISPAGAADRLAIRELVDAYAYCADRRDAKGQMALFTIDTTLSSTWIQDRRHHRRSFTDATLLLQSLTI
jgi:hypothetical protein